MTYEILILFVYVICTTLTASFYGAFQNQISYSVSNGAYFKNHKFRAFEGTGQQAFHETPRDSKYKKVYHKWGNRIGASVIGMKASWWMGLILGLIIGITTVGLFWGSEKDIIYILLWASLIWIGITMVLHIVLSLFFIYIRPLINDKVYDNYYKAGVIHNSAYASAILGTIGSLMYVMFEGGKNQ